MDESVRVSNFMHRDLGMRHSRGVPLACHFPRWLITDQPKGIGFVSARVKQVTLEVWTVPMDSVGTIWGRGWDSLEYFPMWRGSVESQQTGTS